MPYKLRKAPNQDKYWVVGKDGSHKSIEPLPKARAEKQMKALYAVESGYQLGKRKGKKPNNK